MDGQQIMHKHFLIADSHITGTTKRGLHEKHWEKCLRLIEKVKPQKITHLGDLMDFPQLAQYNKANLKALTEVSLEADFKRADAFFNELQSASNAEISVLEGNHDVRLKKWLKEHPAFEGSLSIKERLNFVKRGIKWIDNYTSGSVGRDGDCVFTHGTKIGKHHAYDYLRDSLYGDVNVFYGHIHTFQQHTLTRADLRTYTAQCCGCLCTYTPYYLIGYGNNYAPGCTVLTLDKGKLQQITNYRLDKEVEI